MQNNAAVQTVPLHLKYALTLKEAVQYFGIGERKLQMIADENRDTGIVIYNGVKLLFKREKFEQWLDETNAIWGIEKGHWTCYYRNVLNALFISKND